MSTSLRYFDTAKLIVRNVPGGVPASLFPDDPRPILVVRRHQRGVEARVSGAQLGSCHEPIERFRTSLMQPKLAVLPDHQPTLIRSILHQAHFTSAARRRGKFRNSSSARRSHVVAGRSPPIKRGAHPLVRRPRGSGRCGPPAGERRSAGTLGQRSADDAAPGPPVARLARRQPIKREIGGLRPPAAQAAFRRR
jgi:hypothetical protein